MTPPAAAAAAPEVRPRRPLAPRGPRRVSGPARPAAAPRPRTQRRRRSGEAGIVLDLVGALEGLAQHRMLDRLIRGRVWIGLVAFALLGIVTMQLGLLKLNGGIGRALEHEALLQRENATLSIENSEMAAGSRIEARAAKLGMSFAPGGALRFLNPHAHGDAAAAAAALGSAARASALQASEAAAAASSEAGEGSESSAASEASGAEAAASGSAEAEAGSSASGESEASESSTSEAPTASSEESSATTSSEAAAGASSEAAPGGGIQAGSSGE